MKYDIIPQRIRILNKDDSLSLLDRIIVTKEELLKFQLVDDEACAFRLQPYSIEQTFLECDATTVFCSKAISSITISFGSIMKLASILPSKINS